MRIHLSHVYTYIGAYVDDSVQFHVCFNNKETEGQQPRVKLSECPCAQFEVVQVFYSSSAYVHRRKVPVSLRMKH